MFLKFSIIGQPISLSVLSRQCLSLNLREKKQMGLEAWPVFQRPGLWVSGYSGVQWDKTMK